jgi:hypothetical protein
MGPGTVAEEFDQIPPVARPTGDSPTPFVGALDSRSKRKAHQTKPTKPKHLLFGPATTLLPVTLEVSTLASRSRPATIHVFDEIIMETFFENTHTCLDAFYA